MINPTLRLHSIIEKAYDFGKFPNGFSYSDFRDLEDVYHCIKNRKSATTIHGNVKAVLERCGFTCSPHGIGWIVTK